LGENAWQKHGKKQKKTKILNQLAPEDRDRLANIPNNSSILERI
jgi:hypothetical protein